MSCWVVTSLAAELWGIPVQLVLERVRRGLIPSKTDLGFLLVDVAPEGPRLEGGKLVPGRRRATYTPAAEAVSEAELAALGMPVTVGAGDSVNEAELAALGMPDTAGEADAGDEEAPLEEEAERSRFERSDWRRTRAATGRVRVRPGARNAAA